jgi:hypothetical protein
MPVVCSLEGADCPELRCIMKEDQWFNSEHAGHCIKQYIKIKKMQLFYSFQQK